MERLLERIYDYADSAHGNQLRKYTPERYMVHPKRVMELCQPVTADYAVLAAALLHDVLEDTPLKEPELLVFLKTVLEEDAAVTAARLVVELTDVYVKADFPHLNRSARKARELERMRTISADAQTIKYADILDNCREIVQHDRGFAPRFLKECRQLLQVMNKGHEGLRTEALNTLVQGFKALR